MYKEPDDITISVTVNRRSLSRALIAIDYEDDEMSLDTAIDLFLFAYGQAQKFPINLHKYEFFEDAYRPRKRKSSKKAKNN